MSENETLEHQCPKIVAPPVICEDDVEKSDIVLVPPPPRRSGTIRVQLKYGGRRKPIPVDFPDGEGPDDGARPADA